MQETSAEHREKPLGRAQKRVASCSSSCATAPARQTPGRSETQRRRAKARNRPGMIRTDPTRGCRPPQPGRASHARTGHRELLGGHIGGAEKWLVGGERWQNERPLRVVGVGTGRRRPTSQRSPPHREGPPWGQRKARCPATKLPGEVGVQARRAAEEAPPRQVTEVNRPSHAEIVVAARYGPTPVVTTSAELEVCKNVGQPQAPPGAHQESARTYGRRPQLE